MENFTIKSIYRVQLCPKQDLNGRPLDSAFDNQDLFSFDKEGNCFVFTNNFHKFCEFIKLNFSELLFVRSVVLISDDFFVYEG